MRLDNRQLRFAKIWAIIALQAAGIFVVLGAAIVGFVALVIAFPHIVLPIFLLSLLGGAILIISYNEAEKELRKLEEQEAETLRLLAKDYSTGRRGKS